MFGGTSCPSSVAPLAHSIQFCMLLSKETQFASLPILRRVDRSPKLNTSAPGENGDSCNSSLRASWL